MFSQRWPWKGSPPQASSPTPFTTSSVAQCLSNSGSSSTSPSPFTPSHMSAQPSSNLFEGHGNGTGKSVDQVERENMLHLLQLITKEVIAYSLKYSQQVDTLNKPMLNLLILLEHVLRHGLKTKKGILGSSVELWDVLQLVERHHPDAVDMTTSVRELPTIKTNSGRVRAWLRLTMMQKHLSDYFKILVDRSEQEMAEYYEPESLIRSEEATMLVGLLLGLNVVDCNFCLKDENLDCQNVVIDFTSYLRQKKDIDNDYFTEACEQDGGEGGDNISTILDQKTYLEELNGNLKAKLIRLEAEVASLKGANSRLREELSAPCQICQNRLEEEAQPQTMGKDTFDSDTTSDEKQLREKLEKELKLQEGMNAEVEMANKLLERDVHSKQDTIVTLREQLDTLKKINLEMYIKLQECDKALDHKAKLISRLDEKHKSMCDSFKSLEAKYLTAKGDNLELQSRSETLTSELAAALDNVSILREDLKIEKEMRVDAQEGRRAAEEELEFRTKVEQSYESLQREHESLRADFNDQKVTIEELGDRLAQTKLEADAIKEERRRNHRLGREVSWQLDEQVDNCHGCHREFTIARRRHHCRKCGRIFCDACSSNKTSLPSCPKPARVCDACMESQHYSANSVD